MREKQNRIVITFYTTEEAIAMERECKAANLQGRLIPVPRQLSAGCGLAWNMPVEFTEKIHNLIEEKKLKYENILEGKI